MPRLDPTARPPLDASALITALDRHSVDWVLAGSHVLALHGADIVANDLDVVPDLAPANLLRVAACLEELQATAAYLDGWGGARGTLAACSAWGPEPATATHLDWLFVTAHGMLDIVIEKAEPYDTLRATASPHQSADVTYWVCDPRRVLTALEGRSRAKDKARAPTYAALRARLQMSPLA